MTPEARRVLRFLMVGGLNTGFGYAVYAGFVLAGAAPWLAVGGATLLAFVFNFFSYGGLVFGSTSRRLWPRFLLFYAALGTLNWAMLRALAALGLGPFLAQAVLVPILAAAGYLALRRFVFRGQSALPGP